MRDPERRLTAAEIHARLAGRWKSALVRLGINESFLSGKHSPCPSCGGKDRFRFDDRWRRGDWFCNGCGHGDAFTLLKRALGWTLTEAIAQIALIEPMLGPSVPLRSDPVDVKPATPSARVRDLMRTACDPSDVLDVVRYLKSRHVWPLPSGCALRAHVGAEYFEDRECIGRYPALVAPVVDIVGALVTTHVTYLERGAKLTGHDPRKLLGKLTGRFGCAIRLAPATEVLGIAEGIETGLAAMRLHRIPTWSAVSAAVIAKFEPPAGVERLVIFADRDTSGLEAAWRLRDSVTIPCELRVPPLPSKDWNDELKQSCEV